MMARGEARQTAASPECCCFSLSSRRRRGLGRGGLFWNISTEGELSYLSGGWRNKTVVLLFAHHLQTTGSAIKCPPNIQQHALAVSSPVVIPEP